MEKASECSCCGFETNNLEQYNGEDRWLCILCASTLTSVIKDNVNYDTPVLMKTMCHLANAIIASSEKIKEAIDSLEDLIRSIERSQR
jgi:hypothetical protein